MDIAFGARGLVLGFAIAAPVGPIGVLVIRRTLASGRRHGLASGLGAATADAAYGVAAAFGLTAVTAPLVAHVGLLQLLGGLFLCWLGVATLRARPATQAADAAAARGLWRAFTSTLLLTVTNPMTILSFAAAFAGMGLAGQARDPLSAALLVAGVFVGSVLWWLTLSTAVGMLRGRIGPRALRAVNVVSGLTLLAFGAWAVGGAAR